MKGLETGKDKIQKICDVLRKETLEPAKQEAREIVENAHMEAQEIEKGAREKAKALLEKAEKEIEEKKKVFHSSLQIASRQGIDLLKQKIEKELFDKELVQLVEKEMKDPKLISNLIQALIRALEEKGIEEEFLALVPKEVSPREVNLLISKNILEKLKNQTVSLGNFLGGVQIQLKEQRVTIDISDASIRELLAGYSRKDFRDLIFSA